MSDSTAVYTQWECEMVVYRADSQGRPTDEIEYIGGCENKLEIEQGFAEERADRSGDPYPRNQHLEEMHVIQLESLWLTRYRRNSGEVIFDTPLIGRDQRFVVVMLWQDETSGIWHKRTYFGVQINPLKIGSEQEYFAQQATLRAGYFTQANGRLPEVPDLVPDSFGTVRYVTEAVGTDLYSYNFDDRTFAELADGTGRVEFLGAGGAHAFRIYVGGVLALAVGLDGVMRVKQVVATGGSFASGYPRAEFFNGTTRYATLTAAGVLAVPAFLESAVNPALAEDFELRAGGDWLASLGLVGAFAPAIADNL